MNKYFICIIFEHWHNCGIVKIKWFSVSVIVYIFISVTKSQKTKISYKLQLLTVICVNPEFYLACLIVIAQKY